MTGSDHVLRDNRHRPHGFATHLPRHLPVHRYACEHVDTISVSRWSSGASREMARQVTRQEHALAFLSIGKGALFRIFTCIYFLLLYKFRAFRRWLSAIEREFEDPIPSEAATSHLIQEC